MQKLLEYILSRKMQAKYKNILLFFCAAALAAAGLASGSVLGGRALADLYNGSFSALYLIYMPAGEYYRTAVLLNSPQELHRATGYYALLDNNGADLPFLLQRYKKEDSVFVKKIILWVTTQADDKSAAAAAIYSLKETAAGEELAAINAALKKLGAE